MYGHVFAFKSHKHDDDSEIKSIVSKAPAAISTGADIGKDDGEGDEEEQKRKSIPSRKLTSCGDIQNILHECVQIQDSQAQDVLPWIESLYRESRGFELGMSNSSILPGVLKETIREMVISRRGLHL
ncbi:hypothetical protein N7540_010956 [Penicillium herquei]|nr:hypothetical protein N7540_010956 [Penicillium herquei]